MGKRILIFLHAVCYLLWAGSCIAATEEIMASILNLNEKEFFDVNRSLLAQRESRLLDMDFFGVAVNAPSRIFTAHHNKLPLVMAVRYSGERGWDVTLIDNCILVGTNLQDGSVHFANALMSEKQRQRREERELIPKGLKPSGLALAAAQLTEVDARGRLHIKWNTGAWALGVIYYDWPSNTVVVNLKGDEEGKPSPTRFVHPKPNPLGGEALPCYLPMSRTPQTPETGVTFTVESRMEQGKQQLNVFGAFTVPVRGFHLTEQEIVHQYQEGSKKNVAAVVPVTMAVLALDWDEPLQFDWAVPVYGEPLKVGTPGRGSFAINALANGNTQSLGPGKYVCYIVMEGRIFGPQTFEIQ